MISFDEAREIAIRHIGPRCGLIEKSVIEKPYGWYFMYQGNEYLRTRDSRDMLVGSGGFIVEREGGRVVEFGSAHSLERNFAAYEYGLKYDHYDLTVTRVHDLAGTLHVLLAMRVGHVIPEFAHGRRWRIPRYYDRTQLGKMLRTLPCTFTNCGFSYERALEIDRTRPFEYKLRGYDRDPSTR
jgi:hypothetical protein